MTGAIETTRTAAVVAPYASNGSVGAAPAKTDSLLPAPTLSLSGLDEVYALMSKSNAAQAQAKKAEVNAHFTEKKKALEEYQHQLKKSMEAQHGGGIFKTVAIVGACVGAACALVASAGTATFGVVAVGVALSATGFFASEAKCVKDLVGPEAAQWIGFGCQIAGAAVGGFGGLLASAGTAGEAASTVASGVEKATTTVDLIRDACSQTASFANGMTAVNSGIGTTVHAVEAKESADAFIAATAAQKSMARQQRLIEDCIAIIKEGTESQTRSTKTVSDIEQNQNETTLIAARGTRA